jgi:hypothetical protein
VTGNGTVEIKKRPEIMRVQVEVVIRGKDLKDALTKLKARKEALGKQLADLGAVKDTAEFSDASVTSTVSDRQRQMERMMIGRSIRAPVPDKSDVVKPKQPDPVFVASTLRADWPLKGSSAEEMLLVTHALQEKIKGADLGGLKQQEKTPQEEEIEEEMRAQGGRYGREEEPKRGEPAFLFVCKISEAERDQALAEAFGKAKKEAGRYARAAGAQLGALQNLGSQIQNSSAYDGGFNDSPYYQPRMRRSQEEWGDPNDPGGEAIGSQPTRVTCRISVFASFAVGDKK